jgi:hypothetical protein
MTIYEHMLHDAIDTMLIDEQDFSGRCVIASLLSTYFNPNNFGNASDQLHDALTEIEDLIINSDASTNNEQVLTSLMWLERVYRASAIREKE